MNGVRALAIVLATSTWIGSAGGDEPESLDVLFLGDRGHHVPAERAEQLIPVMASRGIQVTYTDDPTALNAANLAKYDALLLYANIDRIEPDQEHALLGYVAGGGGFVPLHCASYCFRNSAACVDLIGAQFSRHGMGQFDTEVVAPDHAIMRGLVPFRTTDETYVHVKHNAKDRTVLQTRAEGDQAEPWTWVRTHGKGRVFYTAYGHDAVTWGHPGFHDLVERGVRWAANKGGVFDGRPRVTSGLRPLETVPAGAKVPFYPPSTKWGVQGEPTTTMQKPASPGESMKHMALPAGFRVELFAAEPDIKKPLCMNWDARGRLWIVETVDYPNEQRPPGKGRDRIVICEDTDNDGKADRFRVFAEGLSIPTSLLFANGGVIVHQLPDTLFLKDTDGDDRADEKRILFTGWGTRDTHAGPSNLRWGIDNWVYGIVGYSAFHGTVGGERLDFNQGLYRFKADGSKLEFLRSTSNNSWGVGISEDGLLFGSTANGCPSVFAAIPNRAYESVRGVAPGVLPNIADSNRFFPVTEKVRQVDWHGGFTAAAGHALYTARSFPPYYWNRTAFVTDPTGHLVATFSLHPRGTDFASHNAWNLLASDDEWTSPILAEVGPDGAVWVIDWYNYIVQHNPTPQGFETGKGNAYETPLRDKTHGRIYRVVHEGSKPSEQPRLQLDDPKGLVAALRNDNMFWRLHAQRLLVERGRPDIVPDLIKLASDRSMDAIGLNVGAIHALWTLRGLGALDDAKSVAFDALKHPSAGVRRNAVEVLPRTAEALTRLIESGALSDADPGVRLAGLLALSEFPRSVQAAAAAIEALGRLDDAGTIDAVTIAAAAHDREFLTALKGPLSGPARTVAGRVAEHLARGRDRAGLEAVLQALPSAESATAGAIIGGLAKGWPRGEPVAVGEATERALVTLFGQVATASKADLIQLGARLGSDALRRHAAEISATLAGVLGDESKPDAARITAATRLVELDRNDAEAAVVVLDAITARTTPSLAAGLLESVARCEAPELGAVLVERLASLTPSVRPGVVRALLGRPDWTRALLDGFESGAIRPGALALDQKQALAAHPDRAIAKRARALLAQGGGLPDLDRQKVIAALAPQVLRPADAARGKQVFQEQCAKCHIHGGEGAKVGPDLTGMAAHPKEELLVHVLDPSRSVEGNFVQYTVVTTDGQIVNGLLASESKTTIELIDSEGKSHTLARDEVEALKASEKSVMPEGFEKQISADDLANLLAFLTQRGKYLPLDLRPVATAISTRGMFYGEGNAVERLVFEDWSPKTFEGVPFLLVDPRGDRAPNVVLLHSRNGTIPPRMPRSVSLPVNAPARAIHLLSGVSGWGYNGSEAPPTVSMIVRIHYADGMTEDHPLRNGVEFADYIRPIEVPGSKLAFRLRGQQIRYLAVYPKRSEEVRSIEFVKGPDATAPVVMAATVEVRD